MRAKGWEVPGLVPTESGELTTRDLSGRLWRGFEYVPSDVDKENTTLNHEPNPIAYGILLAKLHRTLASFDYKPRFQLPNFHDTDHYAEVLQTVASGLPTTKAQTYAAEVLEAYAQMPSLPAAKEQLIHGDPRTANTLSRDGEPFTFIDWDTEMIGTRWTDLGDMLRSLAEDAVLEGNPIPFDQLINIANGYREEAFPDVDASEFRETAIVAARRIAIELAMRFVADYKDGSEGYFAYDEAAYPSRHTFTMERAKIQMQIFDELKSANLEKGDSQDATSD